MAQPVSGDCTNRTGHVSHTPPTLSPAGLAAQSRSTISSPPKKLSWPILDWFFSLFKSIWRTITTLFHTPTIKRIWTDKDLEKLAQVSLILVEREYYINSNNERIPLANGETLNERSVRFNVMPLNPIASRYERTRIAVLEQDCLDVAQEEARKGSKVAVVNFAGPELPGGGFLDGSGRGQEEHIIWRSDLIGFMKLHNDLQLANPEQHGMFPMYNCTVHTPNVTVYRDHSFAILDNPFKIGILSQAARTTLEYAPPPLRNPGTPSVDYANPQDRDKMRALIYNQLQVAYNLGYDTLITGAFGCGAFRNPPSIVAEIYREALHTHLRGAFKTVLFAILEQAPGPHNPTGNLKPFRDRFGS